LHTEHTLTGDLLQVIMILWRWSCICDSTQLLFSYS